jgi:hypothetical protein
VVFVRSPAAEDPIVTTDRSAFPFTRAPRHATPAKEPHPATRSTVQRAVAPAGARPPHPATIGPSAAVQPCAMPGLPVPSEIPAEWIALFWAFVQAQAAQPSAAPGRRPPHPATIGRTPPGGAAPIPPTGYPLPYPFAQPYPAPGQRPPHPATVPRSARSADAYEALAAQAAAMLAMQSAIGAAVVPQPPAAQGNTPSFPPGMALPFWPPPR